MCVLAAVCYGIVHDQVTARLCVEYFTIGHPPVFATDDPTWLGIGWGIIATWWVGLLLGLPLAVAARVGPYPKRSASSLLRPLSCLLALTAVCALIAGMVGWLLGSNGTLVLAGPIARAVPVHRHPVFIGTWFAHLASYLVGMVGGIVVIISVWQFRRKLASDTTAQRVQKQVLMA